MPYTYKKEGNKYVVYKKDSGKRVGSTSADKESLRKYLAALHIHANESIMEANSIDNFKVGDIVTLRNSGDKFTIISKDSKAVRLQDVDKTTDPVSLDIEYFKNLLLKSKITITNKTSEAVAQTADSLNRTSRGKKDSASPIEFYTAIQKALKNKKNVTVNHATPSYIMVDGKPHKIKNGQLVPLKSVNEDSTATKSAKIKAAQEKIKAMASALKDAQDELKRLQATPVGTSLEEFKLSNFMKGVLESVTGSDIEKYAARNKFKYNKKVNWYEKDSEIETIEIKNDKIYYTCWQHDRVVQRKIFSSVKELDNFRKGLHEAKSDTEKSDSPEDAAVTPPEDSGDSTDTSKDDTADSDAETKDSKSDLTVTFNMAKVKKYNNYPVITNTGKITGASKEGISVLVGDNTIFVNFEDIL